MWCVDEVGMSEVFGTEYGLLHGYAPVDAECLILDVDARLCLGVVEVVTLVLKDGRRTQHGKAMCKAVGHEELTMVVLREFHGNMLAEGRTAPRTQRTSLAWV